MRENRKTMTARERELVRRCLILMAGALFCFALAAARAKSGDYGSYDQQPRTAWNAYEDEDRHDYSVMSGVDYRTAERYTRRVRGARPMLQKQKASRTHDAVTIIINEKTNSELSSSNDLKRDTSNDLTLTNWLTPSLSGGLGTTQHGAAAGGNTPTIAWSGSRKHKSDSTIDRSQSFATTITGEVLAVQPNGYLVVQARKSVNVNGEVQTVTVTGVVNPDHLDANSAVKAEYLMDMSVNYTGKGPMTRMDKRGWGAKIVDFLTPF